MAKKGKKVRTNRRFKPQGTAVTPGKKVSFSRRRNALKGVVAKRKKNKLKEKRILELKQERKEKEIARTAKLAYSPDEKILLVGEGDFSFTAGLIRAWRTTQKKDTEDIASDAQVAGPADSIDEQNVEDLMGFNIVSTCLDSKEELLEKYPSVEKNLTLIKAAGGTVVHNVDCTKLFSNEELVYALSLISQHDEDSAGFDKILFNFPHLGCGICDTAENTKHHQELIRKFSKSAYKLLAPNGQLHITVKNGEPYMGWKVPKIVLETSLYTVRNAFPFLPERYPGYQHRRTLGAASKSADVGGPKANADINKFGARTLVFKVSNSDTIDNASENGTSDDED